MADERVLPFDYYARARRRVREDTPAAVDPIGATIQSIQGQEIDETVRRAPAPDAVARTVKASRETGEPPALIEGREADIERDRQTRDFVSLADRYPAIGRFAVRNPRGAAMAADDAGPIERIGRAFWQGAQRFGSMLSAGTDDANAMGYDLLASVNEALSTITTPVDAVRTVFAQQLGLDYNAFDVNEQRTKYFSDLADSFRGRGERISQDAATTGSNVADAIIGGARSVPLTVAAVATRDPKAAASVLGIAVGNTAYREGRAQGLDPARAQIYGIREGGIEAGTELLPLGTLVDMIVKRTPWGKAFVRELGQELIGEQVATFLQDANAAASLPSERGKTFAQFLAERPAAAADTALATIGGVGTTTGAIAAAQRATDVSAKVSARIRDSRTAKRNAARLEQMEKAAGESRLRQRDPETFREMLREIADGSPDAKVYVPADAVREFQQSDSYDPEGDPFGNVDFSEADATGGDIALPVEDVLTDYVGTPAWEAIRDHVRLEPGGMSKAEADTFDEALDDVMATVADDLARQDATERNKATAREAMADRLTAEFGSAYAPSAARTYAEIAVRLAERRAEAFGVDLTGRELDDLSVRMVLPEGVSEAVKSNDLDLVINAMRKGASPEIGVGSSLLEFIKARGGINDPGGDLASMGMPASMIREFNPDQGALAGISGAGDYGIDSTLRAAIEAGFFPSLQGVEAEAGPSQLDTQALLDAIGQELAGSPVYAETKTDPFREAGRQLREALSEAGLDPDGMTDAEVRAAVDAMGSQDGGRAFEQSDLENDLQKWQARLDDLERGKIADTQMIYVSRVPGALRALGLKGGLRIRASKLRKIAVKHGDKLPLAVVEQLPALLADPRAVFPSFKADGSFVVALDAVDKKGDPIIAAVIPEDGAKGANVVLSVYGKEVDDSGRTGVEWIASGLNSALRSGQNVYFEEGLGGATTTGEADTARSSYGPIPLLAPRKTAALIVDKEQILKSYGRGLYQEARGRIIFDGAKRTIELFKSRNLSTAIHELGHLYVEQLSVDAALPDAPETLRKDFDTLRSWWKQNGIEVEVGETVPEEAHELTARGFETYFMEGKAPAVSLKRLFETVRMWMIDIYKAVRNLKAEITPEVREVFDRALATQEEIDLARQQDALAPLFAEAIEGMTPEEFSAYQQLVEDKRKEANSEAIGKAMRTIRRREEKRYREVRKKIRAEETARIDEAPLFRVQAAMKEERISREWLADTFGEDVFDLLPKRVPPLWVEGGVNPNAIAELNGYAGGKDMIEALIGAERAHRQAKEGGDRRSMRARAIDNAVEAEFSRRYGDPFNDGSIEAEALAAAHSEAQGDIMAEELRILGRSTGQRATPYRAARDWARRKVRGGVIAEEAMPAAIQRYQRNAAKAGRESMAAIVEGNRDEAFRQKQFQMLNSALLAEAKAAMDDVEAAQKRLEKIARAKTRKSVDQDYLEQAHALLESVDLKRRSQAGIERKAAFEKWAAAKREAGEEVFVPEGYDYAGLNWTRMTVESFLALDDTVKSVLHLGRVKQTLLDNKERRDFEDFRKVVLTNLDAVPARKADFDRNTKPSIVRDFLAGGLKVETLAGELDNDSDNGPMRRLLVDRAADAANARDEARERVLQPVADLYRAIPAKHRDSLAETLSFPDLPYRSADPNDTRNGEPSRLTRWELVAMALNMGNASNFDKLARGEQWRPDAIRAAVMENLTKEDWDFVQGVWDALELLKPDIIATEKEMSGITPEWVEPVSVETPFGTYRGGYYPAVYDPARSVRAEANARDEANDLFGMKSGIATQKGHTIARTDYAAPMLLSVEQVLFNHVEKVITRNAYAPWVRDVLKVMRDPAIRSSIDRVLGKELRDMVEPWLQRQINSGVRANRSNRFMENLARHARVNMTVVAMGLRFSTGIAQIIGLGNSAGRIGADNLRIGMARLLREQGDAAQFVFSRSPEMLRRNEEMNRDVAEVFAKMRGSRRPSWMTKAQAFAFWHIGMIDRYMVAVPTWLGAHHKALNEGMTDEQASAYADRAVRESQGSGREKDLSSWQSPDSEFLRFFTMFYTPFNVLLNAQYQAGRAVKRKDWRKAGMITFWFMIATPLLDALLAGDTPDEDDDNGWLTWLLRNVFFYQAAGIPLLRDAGNFAERKVTGEYATFNPGPIPRVFDMTTRTSGDAWDAVTGEDVSDRWLRNAIETPGYFLGLPTGQPAATAQFLYDVEAGRADPDTLPEWYRGLTKGKVEE